MRSYVQAGVETWNTSTFGVGNTACMVCPKFTSIEQFIFITYMIQEHYGTADSWHCYFPQYLMPFIQTPVFVVNSMYDPAQYGIILGFPCPRLSTCNPEQFAFATAYRTRFIGIISDALKTHPRGLGATGFYATSCNQHEETCRQADFEGIKIQDTSMMNAFQHWYLAQKQHTLINNTNVYIDVPWKDAHSPSNPTCNSQNHGAC